MRLWGKYLPWLLLIALLSSAALDNEGVVNARPDIN